MPNAEDMRGFAAREGEADDERPATRILLEKRAADKAARPLADEE